MLASFMSALLAAASVIAALPVLVFFAQVMLAFGAMRQRAIPAARDDDVDVAVLVPAHNEAAGIAATLDSVRSQLRASDRVLVVADNCTDSTAAVARAAGAQVVERVDLERRGKGYALDHGVRHLAIRPPAIVLIVDADCLLDEDTIDVLAASSHASGRPAQAFYEMSAPAEAGLRARVSALAWTVRNRVRPTGWLRLGAPCQLMGTGMAFPWALIQDAPLASGNIVEDMQLGVDLALRGHPPLFVPQARVSSVFPVSSEAASSQRRRWEHGNLSVILAHGPRMLVAGLAKGRADLIAMAADLMVPPLALLVQLQLALIVAGLLALWSGSGGWPLMISAGSLGLLFVTILAAWHIAGRHIIGLGELLVSAPAYALRKLPMYLSYLWRRESKWVRAKRDGE